MSSQHTQEAATVDVEGVHLEDARCNHQQPGAHPLQHPSVVAYSSRLHIAECNLGAHQPEYDCTCARL